MEHRFQRALCLLAAASAAAFLSPLSPLAPRALADDLNAEQVAKKFTPSVMIVYSTSSTDPDAGGQGTAFVLSDDGIVCTNYHVIEGTDKFVLRSSTGGMFPVTSVLATDKKHDIAILKIDAHGLTPLEFGDSAKMEAGQKVFVIGNPHGFESTITEGLVSSLRADGPKGPAIQISAAISPGSSGSPVFNGQGQVIGMATYNYDGQALNFAIPSAELSSLFASARNAKPGAAPVEMPGEAAPEEGKLYEPDASVHGSKAQDTSVFADPRYAKLKDAEKSYDYFEMLSDSKQLVKDYPLSSAASRALTIAYYYDSMPDEAMKTARRALDLDPESPRAWDNLALLYSTYSDDDAMVKAIYTHAIELAPDDVRVLVAYSRGMRSENKATAQSALTHAKRLLMDDKGIDDETSDYHLYSEVVDAYMYLGLNEDAYNTALDFLHKTTSDAWLYLSYAAAAANTNRNTYVKATIAKAVELDPSCKKDAIKIEALFDYDQGDIASAVGLYKQAANMDSRDFSVLSELVYAISNKPQLGQADYQDLDNYIARLKALNPKAGKAIEDKVADIIREK